MLLWLWLPGKWTVLQVYPPFNSKYYSNLQIANRFSTNRCFQDIDPWTRGRAWAEQCRILFNNRAEAVSSLALQSCLLLHILAFIEGDMESQSLYGALAIRMVQLLDLPRKLSPDRIQRETEIRSRFKPPIY
jgi:hypothetical protein